jgi:flagellar assembly protein FliH
VDGRGKVMGQHEKFLFETSFDREQSERAKAAAAAKAAAEQPPVPTFSEEEMEAARQAAFAEGKAAGLAEAEGAQAERLAAAVEGLPPYFTQLGEALAADAEALRRETLGAAITVVRKLFPQLARDHGLEEIQAVVDACLERLRDEPRVVIRCADADLDSLRESIEQSAAQSAFEGKLVFLADERLAAGDLRVEWADGGAERDQAALWKEIDAVIARALKPQAKAEGPKSDAAKAATGEPDKQKAQQPAPKGAAPQSPPPDASAAVQPLRRAKFA